MAPTEQNISYLQNKLWYILKSEENQTGVINAPAINIINENDHIGLKVNDIVKMGRVKFAITEIKIGDMKTNFEESPHDEQIFDLIPELNKPAEINKDTIVCKICLMNGDEKENPLVNLCKCSGSMEFLHFECLKHWMNTKLKTKENPKKSVTSYVMKSFNCEICKSPYPLNFRLGEKLFNLVDVVKPATPNYIIFESLNQMKENNNYKSIHIVSLNENEKVVMGRATEADVRINDISVSRSHSCLVLSKKKIYIKDLKSKFGTLLLITKDLDLSLTKKLSLQIGRTYVESNFYPAKDMKLREKGTFLHQSTLNNFKTTTTNSCNGKKQYVNKNQYLGKQL